MSKNSIIAPLKGWKYLFKKPISVPMDDIFKNPRESRDNYRGFHVNDWEKCIGCGTCGEICPTKAITMVERGEIEEKDGVKAERPVVDYGRCCFCGLCVDICASGSLNMTKGYLFNSSDPENYIHMPRELDITGKEHKLGYVKDESSDLLDLERKHMEQVDPGERKNSFVEIVRGFSKQQAIAESARCVACEICTKTCPANMNIPDYIKTIWDDKVEDGLEILYETNPLPSVCGRICTHMCEDACAIGNRGDAVAIRWLKRYIVDNMPDEQYEKLALASVSKKGNGRVAIVGAGSSGLSAAYYLTTLGYEVEMYEKLPLAGGPMRYGAPRYRLPDDVVDKDIGFIEKLGVKINTGVEIGKNIMLGELKDKFDAVFVATGYPHTQHLDIEGSEHNDVIEAMDFLEESADYVRGVSAMPDIEENVVVIGSGNVAFDVARTLIRFQNEKFGKSSVMMMALEREDQVPADAEEVEEGTAEGIIFNLGCGPQKIDINEDTGAVASVEAHACTRLFDEKGKFAPVFDPSITQCVITKQVYLAIGQVPDFSYISDELQSKMDLTGGKIKVGPLGEVKGMPWLFAGGDIVHGMDIINGVADGHKAALGIDKYLSKK
ncbi:MAG: FAD-dependent oxidoreductase [Clostridia bacterium]|jgi:glutamate synthase (NADPH) small chain|nr:FAD-dependent oxidoreductase [Clostridia bacterium]